MRLPRIFHPGKEWDARYSQWVRRGWVAERQAVMDAEYEKWKRGERKAGTCLDCGQLLNDHPMPERMWRRGADLCARVNPVQEPPDPLAMSDGPRAQHSDSSSRLAGIDSPPERD